MSVVAVLPRFVNLLWRNPKEQSLSRNRTQEHTLQPPVAVSTFMPRNLDVSIMLCRSSMTIDAASCMHTSRWTV